MELPLIQHRQGPDLNRLTSVLSGKSFTNGLLSSYSSKISLFSVKRFSPYQMHTHIMLQDVFLMAFNWQQYIKVIFNVAQNIWKTILHKNVYNLLFFINRFCIWLDCHNFPWSWLGVPRGMEVRFRTNALDSHHSFMSLNFICQFLFYFLTVS